MSEMYFYPSCVKSVKSYPNDNKVRYYLDITLDVKSNKNLIVLMINPSKANNFISDKTTNAIINSLPKNYSNITIINLVPFISSSISKIKKEMKKIKQHVTLKKRVDDCFNSYISYNYKKIYSQLNKVFKKKLNYEFDCLIASGNHYKQFNKNINIDDYYIEIMKILFKKVNNIYITGLTKGENTGKLLTAHPIGRGNININFYKVDKCYWDTSKYYIKVDYVYKFVKEQLNYFDFFDPKFLNYPGFNKSKLKDLINNSTDDYNKIGLNYFLNNLNKL